MDGPSSSTDGTKESLCVICDKKTLERIVKVGAKGKKTLKQSSVERHDSLFADLDFSNEIFIHESCRCEYIKQSNIEAAKRRAEALCTENISPVKRKLRRSSSSSTVDDSINQSDFEWDNNCLFCKEVANEAEERRRRLSSNRKKKICHVDSSHFMISIKTKLQPLTDDYHREILKRINSVQDLKQLKARYHRECYYEIASSYQKKMSDPKIKQTEKIEAAMEEIYDFLLANDECQFTISQLKEAIKISDMIPHEDTIKKYLKQRFPDEIVISGRMGGNTYVCFTNKMYDIFSDAWYNNRSNSIEGEEIKLIDSASELIRRKMKGIVCRMDQYPASDSMFNNVNENIPPLLIRFLDNIIYKDKHHNPSTEKTYSTKIASIANAIMSAARPRSFMSPLQLGTGATFYRKFGSKRIIDICYHLGFSCSYSEVQLYETSAACQAQRILVDPFLQFVSDNSDFNIASIDGRGTFHNLGSIEIITPADRLQKRMPIKRLRSQEIPTETELVEKK